MSKNTMLFASAMGIAMALSTPAAAQRFHPNAEAQAAGQTDFVQDNSGPNCVRDDFGYCARPEQLQQPEQQRAPSGYETMVSFCGGPQWSDRWGRLIDQRIRGSLSGSVFEATGSPYGRFRAQQDAACRAREQMYNLSVRYNGWDNVPPDMQRSAERAWYMATQLGPERERARQFDQTWRRQQERWADKLSRKLGF
jgi:hypothetical protein